MVRRGPFSSAAAMVLLSLCFVAFNTTKCERLGLQPTTKYKGEHRERAAISSPVRLRSIKEQDKWIADEFRAADPSEQEWCTKVLSEGTHSHQGEPKGGQFGQDVFLARNLFLDAAMDGRKGFYVEAGANDYKKLSSTYFFDKCLGWDGLCIEPQEAYHQDLREKRNCTLVPKCLSKDHTDMMLGGCPRGPCKRMEPIPADGNIPSGWVPIQCSPLHAMLQDAGLVGGRDYVDLFVLDVEGAEEIILNEINWTAVNIGALQMEDGKVLSLRGIDYDMSMRGYAKFHQMAIDTLYVRRGLHAFQREELWYPPNWDSFKRHFPK